MVALDKIGAEAATLLTGPEWTGNRIIELEPMARADEVAAQLDEILKLDVNAFASPRASQPDAYQQLDVLRATLGRQKKIFESISAE